MVTVTNFYIVETKKGETFVSLELTGGLELIQSQQTGKFYATAKKTRIPSTFSANVAELMVGQKIDGEIVRVTSEPYEYTNKKTGETLILQHSYSYRPKGSIELIGHTKVNELQEA